MLTIKTMAALFSLWYLSQFVVWLDAGGHDYYSTALRVLAGACIYLMAERHTGALKKC